MIETSNQSGDGIDTLEADGQAPSDRMRDPLQAQALVQRLIQNDTLRSKKRSMVRGLVDGNPPYKASALKAAGRSEACNVNWRLAESYVNSAISLFYDLFCEAPTYATIELENDRESDGARKSRVVTEEFDRLQRDEKSFDYNMQISQYDMVLYGSGPFLFEDALDWRCRAFQTKDLKVPDQAVSDANQWELATLLVDYQPDQLYKFIRDESAATAVGWDVEATKQAIINAHPKQEDGGQPLGWEWYQEQLKTGSFYFSSISKVISVAHIYYREFPEEGETEGRISHKIVLQAMAQTADQSDSKKADTFLFSKPRRYKNWSEVVHPMYYDHGNGGKHYSVTGMGVKMFAAMEYQNRLMCKMADDAFAPKTLFKPTTASATQQMNLLQMGSYGVLPPGFELLQTAVNPLIQDGLLLNNQITNTVSSNLSSYRMGKQDKPGNPITATQANIDASEEAKLGKTQLNRYYAQLDTLFEEKFRRASNPNLLPSISGGKEALAFQARCAKRGVDKGDLAKIRSVKATRVVGQGSAYLRQQSLEFLLGLISMLPEGGRANLIQDVIAARSGQFSVERYFPISAESKRPTDQNAEAMQWVAAMKVGVPPVVTDSQNPVIYAQTFLQAASQAVQSLEQGGNPAEVLQFLEISGMAIAAQLERIKGDTTRKQIYDVLFEQWKKLAGMADELKSKMEADAQAQSDQRQEAQAQGAEMQMAQAKANQHLQNTQRKADQNLQIKNQAASQKLAINDASAAAKISQPKPENQKTK